jgi:hypothetical protein
MHGLAHRLAAAGAAPALDPARRTTGQPPQPAHTAAVPARPASRSYVWGGLLSRLAA